MSLFEEIGGRPTLERVHREFYERLFAHPQLSKFFVFTPREHQETQQTDFMTFAMGGPNNFFGKEPRKAHRHLFITEKWFQARHQILKETLEFCGISPEHQKAWLKIDSAFKSQVVKETIDECIARYADEGIISVD